MQTNRFTPLNHEIIDKFPKLTGSAVKVYHVLASYLPGSIFPKISTIAKTLECSQATVFRSLKQLEAQNIIKRVRNYKLPNIYKFNINILPERVGMLHQQATAKTRRIFGRLMAKMGLKKIYATGSQAIKLERNLDQVNTKNIMRYMALPFTERGGMQRMTFSLGGV